MTSTRLAPSLLLWINFFTSLPSLSELDPISGKPKRNVLSLADLNDGVVLGDIVGEIDPQYFRTLSTLATNQRSLAENWIIRFNSLKRLYKLLIRYFEDVLHTSTTQLVVPNLQLIAKGTEGSEEQICKLAGIILALVVQSEQREKHVARIQKLEVWAQRELMWSIEQVMSKVNSKVDLQKEAARESGEEADSEFYEQQNERSQIINEKDVLQGVYEELVKKFDTLKGDHEDTVRLLALSEKRNVEAVEVAKAGNVDKAAAVFKTEIDRVKSELAKVENVLAESEVLVESQNRTIEELTRSVEDLKPRAEEATKLKDQMDEYRHAAEKAKKTENVIEKYKKKLEESADLRRNIKALEDQNSDLLDKNVALEEEFATASAFKPLIESYKSQLVSLESKTSNLTRENDTLRHEATRSKEKLKLIEIERKKENESLILFEERVKELELANANRRGSKDSEGGSGGEDLEDAMTGTTMTDLKLQVRKLKRELDLVKGNSEASSKVVVLENLLEDSNRMKSRYEGDYLREHREKLVLESKLEDIMSGKSKLGEGPEASIALRQRLNETVDELETLKKKSLALEVEHDTLKNELIIAKSDLTLVGKDQLDILKLLRESVSTEKIALKEELNRLKTSLQAAEDSMQMQLSQVNTLLMEKVSLQSDGIDQRDKMLEKEKDLGDMRASQGRSEAEFATLQEENTRNAASIEKYRLKLEKAKEFIKAQDEKFQSAQFTEGNGNFEEAEQSYLSQITTLKEELERQKSNNADVEAQYRREQQLMLSAWHDMGMRTIRESVSTGSAPKNASWLARERARSNGSGLRNA